MDRGREIDLHEHELLIGVFLEFSLAEDRPFEAAVGRGVRIGEQNIDRAVRLQ